MANDYKIPCPKIFEELAAIAEPIDLWEIFRTYLTEFLTLTNIIPVFKKSNDSKCQWELIVQDTLLRGANKVTRDAIWRILEVNKPRNCDPLLLDYTGGCSWRITFTVSYCVCESVFLKTRLEDHTPGGFSRQDDFKLLKYLASPYDNGLCCQYKAKLFLNAI